MKESRKANPNRDTSYSTIIVKCEYCGTEYEMPNIGVKPIMKDCPVCRELDEKMSELLGDLYVKPKSLFDSSQPKEIMEEG